MCDPEADQEAGGQMMGKAEAAKGIHSSCPVTYSITAALALLCYKAVVLVRPARALQARDTSHPNKSRATRTFSGADGPECKKRSLFLREHKPSMQDPPFMKSAKAPDLDSFPSQALQRYGSNNPPIEDEAGLALHTASHRS